MKLIIQIPCYNEEDALAITLSQLPREVVGFDSVEWLIIDDGSTDDTVEIARANGVDHIVRHPHHVGLARGFMSGLEECLSRGADVLVNTDADNQYCADDIPKLIQPILDGKAHLVIGARPIAAIQHFSPVKKHLQKLGSWVVRAASKTDVPDAPSGFRAISKEAAQRMLVFSDYTYTLETIIQAGQNNIAVASVPVRVNQELRPSRLVKNMSAYVRRSIMTIFRIFIIYQPFKFFSFIGLSLLMLGIALGVRFLFYYFSGDGEGHIQSVVLSGVLLLMGFQTILVAFLADLLSANRKLIEEVRYRQYIAADDVNASAKAHCKRDET